MKKYHLGEMPAPIPPELLQRLLKISTATVGHFYPWGFLCPEIQPLRPIRRVVGTAVTIALPGEDSTLLHHVISHLGRGYVLCIDRLGDRQNACWGGGLTLAAMTAGLNGVVIDGPCTDPDEIRLHGYSVWSRGMAARTTKLRDIGGRFNVPVCCGGVAVCPGDAVLADESGVVVVPRADVEDVCVQSFELLQKITDGERRLRAREPLGEVYGASALVRSHLETVERA